MTTPESRNAAFEIYALDALEEKWRTEPTDLGGWANRATQTLALARRWRQAAREWEEQARKEAHRVH